MSRFKSLTFCSLAVPLLATAAAAVTVTNDTDQTIKVNDISVQKGMTGTPNAADSSGCKYVATAEGGSSVTVKQGCGKSPFQSFRVFIDKGELKAQALKPALFSVINYTGQDVSVEGGELVNPCARIGGYTCDYLSQWPFRVTVKTQDGRSAALDMKPGDAVTKIAFVKGGKLALIDHGDAGLRRVNVKNDTGQDLTVRVSDAYEYTCPAGDLRGTVYAPALGKRMAFKTKDGKSATVDDPAPETRVFIEDGRLKAK